MKLFLKRSNQIADFFKKSTYSEENANIHSIEIVGPEKSRCLDVIFNICVKEAFHRLRYFENLINQWESSIRTNLLNL